MNYLVSIQKEEHPYISEWYERRLNKVDACGNKIPDEKLIRFYENLNGRKPI